MSACIWLRGCVFSCVLVLSLADVDVRPDCTAPPKVGSCKARYKRFYFDPETEDCKEFVYGGCDGNGNNYVTIENCQDACLESQSSKVT